MRKQLALGAGIALVIGAAVVGCKSDSRSGSIGGFLSTVDLNNGDNAPMSAIATNNLSADGGGFSSGYQNFVELAMKVNKKPSGSDGPATSADGSAVCAFQTSDQLDGHFRLYMSYFDGSTFTPPIEVTGQDRDEFITGNDITMAAMLMIPLNTSGYKGSAGSTTGDAGAVRAQSGNWVIVWDATTFTSAGNQNYPSNTNQPNQSTLPTNGATGFAASGIGLVTGARIQQNLQGPHRALFETVFLKSLHSTPSAFSQALGTNSATASSSTSSVASREYRYGFLVDAPQITLNLGGNANAGKRGREIGYTSGALGALAANINANPPSGGTDIVSLAESVQSYGFASDGIAGCAKFSGNGSPFASGNKASKNTEQANNPGGANGGFATVDQPHTFLGNATDINGHGASNANSGTSGADFGSLVANASSSRPNAAKYTVGEDVSFVQLFWTQILSSANSGDTTIAMTPTEVDNVDLGLQAGNRLAMFRAGLDLRTLAFDSAPAEVTLPTANVTEGPQHLKAATSPLCDFGTYNQFMFMNFVDASLAFVDPATSGFRRGNPNGSADNFIMPASNASVREFNLALMEFAITDQGNGSSAVGTPVRLGVVPQSAMTKDNLDNDKWTFSNLDTETFGNQDQAWLGQCCMFGPDEGLGDLTVFFLEKHSSAGAISTDTNVDTELCAAVLQGTGALVTTGKNPLVLSVHGGENTDSHNVQSDVSLVVGHPNQGNLVTDLKTTAAPVSGTVFQDPVEVDSVQCCMNRAGTYVIVSYGQFIGTSSGNFSRALEAVVMKTFRVVASNGGSTQSSSSPQVDTRFAAGTVTFTGSQPSAGNAINAAIRLDIVGTTGQALTGQPGNSTVGSATGPTVPNASGNGGNNGTTQLSSGAINMLYVPNNGFFDLSTPRRFPTSTNVNSATICPCGYKCEFQSDTQLTNVIWEQSDDSEDRVYVRQIKVDVTAATPVVTLGASVGELESANPVKGDAILKLVQDVNGVPNFDPTPVRSQFDFIDGDTQSEEGLNLVCADLGVDAAGKGGGLLIAYAKTTDATQSDGTFFNREVIAVQWDGASLGSTRTVISRGSALFEASTSSIQLPITQGNGNVGNAPVATNPFAANGSSDVPNFAGNYFHNTGSVPNPGGGAPYSTRVWGSGPSFTPNTTFTFSGQGGSPAQLNFQGKFFTGRQGLHTSLVGALQVPSNSDNVNKPSFSPTSTYIYMAIPTGDNSDTSVGLFTRKFDHSLRTVTSNTAAFGDQFRPTAGTGTVVASPPSGFDQPVRMDHMTGGDVTSVINTNQDGTTATVLFWQDGHVWLSGTDDGVTYTNDGKGSADPFLVDNDTSASTQFAETITYDSSSCNSLHHSIFFFGKNDLSQTNGSLNPTTSSGQGSNGNNSARGNFSAFRLRLRVFN